MTIKQVIARGFTTRTEHGDPRKIAWINQESARRFMDLQWFLESRRIAVRAAHRRWKRRTGQGLAA